jgi:hypothetical protein
MTGRDWHKEWEVEQQDLDDLLKSLAEFNACEHEWREPTEEDGIPFEAGMQVCDKCGGGQVPVTQTEFEQISGLLEATRATED